MAGFDRDELMKEARARLDARSPDYFVKEFNMPKQQVVDIDAVWNLADLRGQLEKLQAGAADPEKLAHIHAEIWTRSLILLVGYHNLTLEIIREGGVPVNDSRVHDYVAALNLITLQYGILTEMDGESRLRWHLIYDEGLRLAGMAGAAPAHDAKYLYDVALSFAGEDRHYARDVASFLRRQEVRVFFDEDEAARMLGKDLSPHLADIYASKSQLCVVFASRHYRRKPWTRFELEAAQRRHAESHGEYLIQVKLDGVNLPGISKTVAFVDGRRNSPEKVAAMIASKLKSFHPAAVRHVGPGSGTWTSPPEEA
jgi:hypothetical protein